MIWKWNFTKKSEIQFKKLDNETKKRVTEKLNFWIETGAPLRFSENLINHGMGSFRFRVGDYRITFDVEDETIVVLAVGHRREIYK